MDDRRKTHVDGVSEGQVDRERSASVGCSRRKRPVWLED